MAARPPPPPPTIGATSRITSTADRPRSCAPWSKLATRCALPSRVAPSTTAAGESFERMRSDIWQQRSASASATTAATMRTPPSSDAPSIRPATLPFSAAGAAGADRAACLISARARRPGPAAPPPRRPRRAGGPARPPAVIASIRRIPCDELVSRVSTKAPISAVERTCVPPHSSRDTSLISTTRTCSPYFSPNSIVAPSSRAWSWRVTKMCSGWFWTSARSRSARCRPPGRGSSGPAWRKSKRSLSGPTYEPAWVTCSPSTSRSAACSRCVAV